MKDIRFIMLKVRQTKSLEMKAEGAIRIRHVQTPNTQYTLMSSEDLLFIIRMMRGIFQRGKIMPAKNAILCIMDNIRVIFL